MSEDKLIGIVKWYNASKGYGFISSEGGPDVFVHYASIEGHTTLEEGDRVCFVITKSPKGLEAKHVVKEV